MSKKLCKIHYRKLRREDGIFPEQALSKKISEALKEKKSGVAIGANVSLRVADVPRAEGYKRLFNDTHETEEFVF